MLIVKHTARTGEVVIRAVDGVRVSAPDEPAGVLIDDPVNGPWFVRSGLVEVFAYQAKLIELDVGTPGPEA